MTYFDSAEEVYAYVGDAFRRGLGHPDVGPLLAASDLTIGLYLTEPTAQLTLHFTPPMRVSAGTNGHRPDVRVHMTGDIADRFMRGEYNLAIGLRRNEVQAQGDVNGLVALLPALRPLFPLYRNAVRAKGRLQNETTLRRSVVTDATSG